MNRTWYDVLEGLANLIEKSDQICDIRLTQPEINPLIKTMQAVPGTRAENLEVFYATFPNRADAEPGLPCAGAVLDAAAK